MEKWSEVFFKKPELYHNHKTYRSSDIFFFQFRTDLNSAHWQTEIEGLGAIVRLMKYHSDIILVDVNDLIHAVNHECKNLRSQVCVFFISP